MAIACGTVAIVRSRCVRQTCWGAVNHAESGKQTNKTKKRNKQQVCVLLRERQLSMATNLKNRKHTSKEHANKAIGNYWLFLRASLLFRVTWAGYLRLHNTLARDLKGKIAGRAKHPDMKGEGGFFAPFVREGIKISRKQPRAKLEESRMEEVSCWWRQRSVSRQPVNRAGVIGLCSFFTRT